MKKVSKKVLFLAFILIVAALGVSYSFFNYYRLSDKQYEIITGDIFLNYIDGSNSLSLINKFPETVEEARANEDNVINFSIEGINTIEDESLYFEIILNEDNDIDGKKRMLAKHLRFDLVEKVNGNNVFLVENMSYDDFNERKIWVDVISAKTTNQVSRQFQLRMWIGDDVIISDTDVNASYSASEYKNYYANVKLSVYGDLSEKSSPYNYFYGTPNEEEMSFWPEDINAQRENIKEVHFVSLKREQMESKYNSAAIKADVTDTTKNSTGKVLTWLEVDEEDNSKYIMYVASDGKTFFPENSLCMFAMFTSLTNIEFSNIDTRNVTNMMGMFAMCTSLENINLNSFDTSNVTYMTALFAYCTSFETLDVSNLNMSKVESIGGMFGACSNLKSLNISNWDLSSVSEYDEVFIECSSLTDINMSNWKNITYLQFFPTQLITDLPNLNLNMSNWDMTLGLMISNIFEGMTNLVSLDLSNWNTRYFISMKNMFKGCTNLVSLDLTGWNTENVTDMSGMFYGCASLTNLDISHFNTKNVTNMSEMFSTMVSLSSLDLSGFNTKNVINMSNMFSRNWLTSLNVSSFNTRNVTDMSGMFSGMIKITSLDLSNFDTRNVTNMGGMFSYCSLLEELNVNNFDTRNVTNMAMMFMESGKFDTLDLSSFDTRNVTVMSDMFNLCGVDILDLRNFTFNDALKSDLKYYDCMFVVSGIRTIYVKSNIEQEWILSLNKGLTTENVIIATN